MHFSFSGPLIEWRGPAPFVFVRFSESLSAELKLAAAGLEYWGQVAVAVTIAGVEFTTALFPRDGVYLLPLKAAVRSRLAVEVGDWVEGELSLTRR